MEFIIEFICEFFLEMIVGGGSDIVKNRRLSKWIRYPVAALLFILCFSVLGVLGMAGFILISQGETREIAGGIILIFIDIVLIILFAGKIRQIVQRLKSSPAKPKVEDSGKIAPGDNPFES